jgi:hypothetical protein
MAVHVSKDAGMRGSQGTASLKSTISAEEVWWCEVPYPTPKNQLVHIHGNLNAVRHRDEVLTPHMLPAMDLCREVFQHDNARPHTARTTVDFLAIQNVTVLPWPFKSLDLNPIERLWMTWIDACAVVNQRRKLCARTTAGSWARMGENSARPYSSIDRVYAETGPCCVTG